MDGFSPKSNYYSIALILLYIKCYETTAPTTSLQSHNTYFIQRNPPWLIQYIGQSDINRNVLKEQKKANYNSFNDNPNDIIVPKYRVKTYIDEKNSEPHLTISAEAFASNGVPKYVRKTTTIKPIKSFETALDENEWWSQYFQTLDNKKPLLNKRQGIAMKWEPTRTSNAVLQSQWSRTATRTPVLKDAGQNQSNLVQDHNVRYGTFKPSIHTMNEEPYTVSQEPINAVNSETDKALLSWREYDMRDINKTRHMIKGIHIQRVPQRTILKSVFIL